MVEHQLRPHPFEEGLRVPTRTKLSMIIDPDKQEPQVAAERVVAFLKGGGRAVMIGGSGAIEPKLFEETTQSVLDVTTQNTAVPVWILPGHIDQIPQKGTGISGVLNYSFIMGSNDGFENAYPPYVREYVARTLAQRQIPSISTLYILCGDPNASVSQVSGIAPMDLNTSVSASKFLEDTQVWLERNIDTVFFESGSNSSSYVHRDVVLQTRQLIDAIAPRTLLIVSGGIKSPSDAGTFAGIADYVNIGGYFEKNGMTEVKDFVAQLG